MRSYLVFGAGGSIGGKIVRELTAQSYRVIAAVRRPPAHPIHSEYVNYKVLEDVADRKAMKSFTDGVIGAERIDGVLYAVGRCPPDGFTEAIRHPLSELPVSTYADEIGMHQLGALNAFQCLLRKVVDGGCFVFFSSAITRLKGRFPSFLQAYHHASVIAAEDWLIEGMRHDPAVSERGIKIHRLAPVAVDTPFHRSGPKPPKLVTIDTVAAEAAGVLTSVDHVDRIIE